MIYKSPLHEFCEKKGVPDNVMVAFGAYARSVYAKRFVLSGESDTVRLLINHLTEEQMEQLWLEFINELRRLLPTH